jgi:beta-N-acetylhexosaminidase
MGFLLSPNGWASTDPIDQILATLSLEQKLGQMLLVGVPEDSEVAIDAGGVIFLGNQLRDIDQIRPRVDRLQARAQVPLFIAADVEGGTVNRLVRHPELAKLPSALSMAQESPETTQEWGRKVGQVMKTLGLNCNLAPVLDLADQRGLMWKSERSFGADVDQVAAHGRAFSLGLRSEGVAPFGKHFPGYGDLDGNSDHELLTDARTVEQIAHHIRAFQQTGEALTGVMLTNVAFDVYGQVPAPFSTEIVGLAHAQGWLVVTDDLAVPVLAQATEGDRLEVFRRAFLAGADLLLTTWPVPSDNAPDYVGTLKQMVQQQPELGARVDVSVRRILQAKQDMGLLPQP